MCLVGLALLYSIIAPFNGLNKYETYLVALICQIVGLCFTTLLE